MTMSIIGGQLNANKAISNIANHHQKLGTLYDDGNYVMRAAREVSINTYISSIIKCLSAASIKQAACWHDAYGAEICAF